MYQQWRLPCSLQQANEEIRAHLQLYGREKAFCDPTAGWCEFTDNLANSINVIICVYL